LFLSSRVRSYDKKDTPLLRQRITEVEDQLSGVQQEYQKLALTRDRLQGDVNLAPRGLKMRGGVLRIEMLTSVKHARCQGEAGADNTCLIPMAFT
jgi:hypothetical protein